MVKNTAASHVIIKLSADGYGNEVGAVPFVGEGY